MSNATNLFLIDEDFRRRAAVTYSLSNTGIHVEPFENVAEITDRWPSSGVLLVHDERQAIAALLDHMDRSGNWLPLIAFSENLDARRIARTIRDGAVDYISWPIDGEDLVAVIREAEETPTAFGRMKRREASALNRIDRLTKREKEVLAAVAGGLSNRLIAERLAISPRTVENHRANMLNKIGATHTSEAIRVAIEAQLINAPT
jgi:two-component system response regulator FixJ